MRIIRAIVRGTCTWPHCTRRIAGDRCIVIRTAIYPPGTLPPNSSNTPIPQHPPTPAPPLHPKRTCLPRLVPAARQDHHAKSCGGRAALHAPPSPWVCTCSASLQHRVALVALSRCTTIVPCLKSGVSWQPSDVHHGANNMMCRPLPTRITPLTTATHQPIVITHRSPPCRIKDMSYVWPLCEDGAHEWT